MTDNKQLKLNLHITLIEGLITKIMNIYGRDNCYWDGFNYIINDGVYKYGELNLPDLLYPMREYGEVIITGDVIDIVNDIRKDPQWLVKLKES